MVVSTSCPSIVGYQRLSPRAALLFADEYLTDRVATSGGFLFVSRNCNLALSVASGIEADGSMAGAEKVYILRACAIVS